MKSSAPGREAVVHLHPLQPEAWIDIDSGTQLRFGKRWPRALGEGEILARARAPEGGAAPAAPASAGQHRRRPP